MAVDKLKKAECYGCKKPPDIVYVESERDKVIYSVCNECDRLLNNPVDPSVKTYSYLIKDMTDLS